MEKETQSLSPTGQKRERQAPAQEVDELSLDTERTSLLDVLDGQLRNNTLVSRLLCICQIDEKKQKELEDEFTQWIEGETEISGVLAFIGPVALHLLEGPTQKVFRALERFNAFHETMENGVPLISNLKILYVSELYTSRAASHWSCFSHIPAKGNALGPDSSEAERIFQAYKTLLLACEKVSGQLEKSGSSPAKFRNTAPPLFKNFADSLVAPEDLNILLSKECENPFTYPQFRQFFVEEVSLNLESDKLWPMPPAPVY